MYMNSIIEGVNLEMKDKCNSREASFCSSRLGSADVAPKARRRVRISVRVFIYIYIYIWIFG